MLVPDRSTKLIDEIKKLLRGGMRQDDLRLPRFPPSSLDQLWPWSGSHDENRWPGKRRVGDAYAANKRGGGSRLWPDVHIPLRAFGHQYYALMHEHILPSTALPPLRRRA